MKLGRQVGLGIGVMAVLVIVSLMTPWTGLGSSAESLLEKFQKEYRPAVSLLPADVSIKPGFEPSEGSPIGNVQMVQGDVYVVHKGSSSAYLLKENLPLFVADTLVSGERSRLSAKMRDKSVFALAPNSKLVLDKSFYDPSKDERSSLLTLLFGKTSMILESIRTTFTKKVRKQDCIT